MILQFELEKYYWEMIMKEPYYQYKDIIIYNDDCMNILRELPDKSFDLIITDPPYGIGIDYGVYQDTQDNLLELIKNVMPEMLRVAKTVVITCGVLNIQFYPAPTWIMAWVIPAGTGRNAWGFSCWQPILCYGNDPYLARGLGARPDIIIDNSTRDNSTYITHPVQKPLIFWEKLIKRASLDDSDTILDPFMGSGTTLVAAKLLGKRAIGIEINEKYCNIAKQRLSQEVLNLNP